MSRLMGHIRVEPNSDGQGGGVVKAAIHVSASVAGVELHADPRLTLETHESRTLIAMLEVATLEVERMRAQAQVAAKNRAAADVSRVMGSLLKTFTADQISKLNDLLDPEQREVMGGVFEKLGLAP